MGDMRRSAGLVAVVLVVLALAAVSETARVYSVCGKADGKLYFTEFETVNGSVYASVLIGNGMTEWNSTDVDLGLHVGTEGKLYLSVSGQFGGGALIRRFDSYTSTTPNFLAGYVDTTYYTADANSLTGDCNNVLYSTSNGKPNVLWGARFTTVATDRVSWPLQVPVAKDGLLGFNSATRNLGQLFLSLNARNLSVPFVSHISLATSTASLSVGVNQTAGVSSVPGSDGLEFSTDASQLYYLPSPGNLVWTFDVATKALLRNATISGVVACKGLTLTRNPCTARGLGQS